MADSIFQPMRFTIDLDSALVTQTGCGQLIYGDKSANVIEVKVQRGGKTIDLTDVTATGAFYRPVDGAEVPLPGAISANVVSVQLIDECYETEGHYEAEVKLSQGEVRRTILSIVGYVYRAGSGAVVNVTGVVPSIPELLAQISAMDAAAERANTAAARAEALAINANGYAQNAKQLNGKDAKYYLSARNLLDNSDFRNPVNQRGNTETSTNGYFIDRWYFLQSGDSASASVSRDGLKYTTASQSWNNLVSQPFVASEMLGKTVTFAAKIKSNSSAYVSLRIVAANTPYNNAQQIASVAYSDKRTGIFAVTANIPESLTYERVNAMILVYEPGEVVIEWAALYEGEYTAETLPPYVPKGYVTELLECQRYYYQTQTKYGNINSAILSMPAGSNNSIAGIQFPVEMRSTPTVNVYGITEVAMSITHWSSDATISDLSIRYINEKAFGLYKSGALTSGDVYAFHYTASADL